MNALQNLHPFLKNSCSQKYIFVVKLQFKLNNFMEPCFTYIGVLSMSEIKLCLRCSRTGHSSSSCKAFSGLEFSVYTVSAEAISLLKERAQLLQGIDSIRSLPKSDKISEKNERMRAINEIGKMITEVDKKLGNR